jgi:hypothetical protein
MNNVTILRLLTAVASGLSTLAALDLASIAQIFDPTTAKYLLAAGPASLAMKELVVVLGDLFDDGKPNQSFKIGILGRPRRAISSVKATASIPSPILTPSNNP